MTASYTVSSVGKLTSLMIAGSLTAQAESGYFIEAVPLPTGRSAGLCWRQCNGGLWGGRLQARAGPPPRPIETSPLSPNPGLPTPSETVPVRERKIERRTTSATG